MTRPASILLAALALAAQVVLGSMPRAAMEWCFMPGSPCHGEQPAAAADSCCEEGVSECCDCECFFTIPAETEIPAPVASGEAQKPNPALLAQPLPPLPAVAPTVVRPERVYVEQTAHCRERWAFSTSRLRL